MSENKIDNLRKTLTSVLSSASIFYLNYFNNATKCWHNIHIKIKYPLFMFLLPPVFQELSERPINICCQYEFVNNWRHSLTLLILPDWLSSQFKKTSMDESVRPKVSKWWNSQPPQKLIGWTPSLKKRFWKRAA